jgi:hypothetical protein
MKIIYRGEDKQDYLKRVELLNSKFRPELCDCRSSAESDGTEVKKSIYHLSNGLTLKREEYTFQNGDFYCMSAAGSRRKISRIEKMMRAPLPKESSSK